MLFKNTFLALKGIAVEIISVLLFFAALFAFCGLSAWLLK